MKKILFVTGSGGHSTESLILFEQIKDKFEFEFLLENDDPFTKKQIKELKIYEAITIRGKKENFLFTIFRGIKCSIESFFVFIKSKPDIILSAGPGIAIPISYLGKLFGKKIIFIESWSRVNTKSIAGKFIYPISNQFYVQWPEMTKIYKKGIYKGRLG